LVQKLNWVNVNGLFLMLEQGGNTPIGLLIEDLRREHVAHEKMP
jgi:hypothetical protein